MKGKEHFDLIVAGGLVVLPSGVCRKDIGVAEGKITALRGQIPPELADRVVNAENRLVMAGTVDTHVHFNEPNLGHWEGFRTGSAALAAGGCTAFADMPLNGNPPTVTLSALKQKQRLAAEDCSVDYAFWGGVMPGYLDELPALAEAGVIGFKAFMSNPGGEGKGRFRESDRETLLEGMKRIAAFNGILALHAESEALTSRLAEAEKAAGQLDAKAFIRSRPVEAEVEAVSEALELAALTGCRLHFVHISSPEAVDVIEEAKRRGQDVTLETCPHYLVLTDEDMERIGPAAKCAPPLRDAARLEQLWERLAAGSIDFVVSDHSPSPESMKSLAGGRSFFEVWGGIAGAQNTLELMLQEGWVKRGIPLPQISALLSANPAKRFGLYPRKGEIAVGFDADLVLIDQSRNDELKREHLRHRHPHSPYLGRTFTCKVTDTFCRGQQVYSEDGSFSEQACGEWLVPVSDPASFIASSSSSVAASVLQRQGGYYAAEAPALTADLADASEPEPPFGPADFGDVPKLLDQLAVFGGLEAAGEAEEGRPGSVNGERKTGEREESAERPGGSQKNGAGRAIAERANGGSSEASGASGAGEDDRCGNSEEKERGKSGVTRLLYTSSWRKAQDFLAATMAAAGLEVRFDRVGNLYGRLPGANPDLPVILTGSHVDTVRAGGKYDGAYGIAAAITALARLKERFGRPQQTLEVVSLCEEEGSRFPLAFWGSGNVTGFHRPEAAEAAFDAAGITLQQAMLEAGFGRLDQPEPQRGDVGMFIELHIEQGAILEKAGAAAGIVETIVGQRRLNITVRGQANHAGTTPMRLRTDALAGAAEMLYVLEAMALEAGEPLVATAGKIAVVPDVSNVIPGEAVFSVDIRHDRAAELAAFCRSMEEAFARIAHKRGLELTVEQQLKTKPVPLDPELGRRFEKLCGSLGLPCRRMVSGAGHDAQLFAAVCKSALLFVPSRGGISHSPEEYTPPERLREGAALLASLLYELAYK